MKKIFGFLGAAALVAFASCSSDVMDGPEAPKAGQGDLFLSMTIRPDQGTRTPTPDQGAEIGKDRENKISSALLLIVDPNPTGPIKNQVIAKSDITNDVVAGVGESYVATFGVNRQDLLDNINGADKDYDIYVIANPGAIANAIVKGEAVNRYFSLPADAATYWTADKFLMSNAEKTTKTINKDDIKVGTHITPTDPYKLGTVKVQRAMSRFDINTGSLEFTVVNGKEDGTGSAPADDNDVTITFDGVALVNQATKAYLFKVTSDETTPLTQEAFNAFNESSILFNDEAKISEGVFNFVISPNQTAFSLPLFVNDNPKDFTSFNYDLFGEKVTEDDNAYDMGEVNHPVSETTYKIWRYCMENTIFDKSKQVHGISTGVIFRAKMTGSKFEGNDAVYAFGNVVFGPLADLVEYATNDESDTDDTGVYSRVAGYYADALEAVKKAWNENEDNAANQWNDEEWTENDDMVAAFNQVLVKEFKFTIYRPDAQGNFYCYYTYWNRHNDNGNNAVMGDMEFATVRNNVYKLSVTSVVRLGHPGSPDDDPDPEDPGTPDEKDTFYCTVDCVVLPWEVRINNVEF